MPSIQTESSFVWLGNPQPESRARGIESVQTDALDLSTVVSRAEYRVNAYVADPQVRFSDTPVVIVRVTVSKTNKETRPASPVQVRD